jgi:hypothetical protein
MLYTDPATGNTKKASSTMSPAVTGPDISRIGVDKDLRQIGGMLSVKGNGITNMQDLMGAYFNAVFGDFRTAHGALEGCQTRLAAATVANTSTTINVESDVDEYGNPLFEAGMLVVITTKLPETIYKHHQDEVVRDAVRIGDAYEYGTTAKTAIPIVGFGTAGAIEKAFQIGAFVQHAKVFPGSMGINGEVGALASYERPSAVTGLAVSTSTASEIDAVSWDEHDQLRSDGFVVGGFDVYVLKHGQGICAEGEPKGPLPHFLPSVEDNLPTPADSKHTLGSSLTQYFDQSTNQLTSIDSGVFYVIVVPVTASDIGEKTRYGHVAVESVTVSS